MTALCRIARRTDAAWVGGVAAVLFAIMLPLMLPPGGRYFSHGFWKVLYVSAQQATWLIAFVDLRFPAERERKWRFRRVQARPDQPGQKPVDHGLVPN